MAQAVTGKLAGVLASAQIEVASVSLQVINPVGDDDALGKTVKVVVVGAQCLLSVQMAIPIEVAQVFLLLGVHADNRIAGRCIPGFQANNVLKLLIAVLIEML